MSVAMTGRPMAAASMAARGNPSRCEASTKTSMAAYMRSTSVRMPSSRTPARSAPAANPGPRASGFSGSSGPMATTT